MFVRLIILTYVQAWSPQQNGEIVRHEEGLLQILEPLVRKGAETEFDAQVFVGVSAALVCRSTHIKQALDGLIQIFLGAWWHEEPENLSQPIYSGEDCKLNSTAVRSIVYLRIQRRQIK